MENYSSRTYVRIRRMVRYPEFIVVYGGKMVQDNYSSRKYVRIRRIVLVAHDMASNIYWNSYSSKTYVRIRRKVLISLYGVTYLTSCPITHMECGFER